MTRKASERKPETVADEKSREVRLGLVMYGGISLAIYINGVAQEFFRAVRGRGIYRLLKALTDSDIVVDVMSGTSAGGINGIFLSYALCNEKEFSDASSLWREHGDINRLLRAPESEIPNASSFLDSEGYYQPHLEESFRNMRDYVPEADEDPSELKELDLFVTGTDVQGRVYTQFDDAGHPIDVKDHRTVFLLKHRKGRKEPFNPKPPGERNPNPAATYEALAKLSRITSCFPVAFASVLVDNAKRGDSSADAKLQSWGQIKKAACFLDGGVLDNKPFSYTIQAIFSRTADREVDRKLFYIEPDPEVLPKDQDKPNPPNFLQAALAALIGIPSYESISEDLKLLSERNSKLMQYQRLVKELRPGGPETAMSDLYIRSRLVFLSERVIQGILRRDGGEALSAEDRKKAADLVRQFDGLTIDTDQVFETYDVAFRLRRVYRIIYLIYELLYGGQPVAPERFEPYRNLWRALNRQLKLYEVLTSAMEGVVDSAPIPWQAMKLDEIWSRVADAYARLLDGGAAPAERLRKLDVRNVREVQPDEWLPQAELSALSAELKALAEEIVEHPDAVPGQPPGLLALADALERGLVERFVPDPGDPVRKAYEEFEALDSHIFPLEMVGGLREKDVIETIRISPRDARRGFSQNDLASKVAGDSVYHFGGFFKRSWRSNDILWGRLDGLCQLVETLLDPERIGGLVESQASRDRLRRRFHEEDGAWTEALDPAHLFPSAGARTHKAIGDWIDDLLSEDPDVRHGAAETRRFEAMIDLLVEAAQLEVLKEDLPNVITDALAEQAEWNRFQVPEAAPKKKTRARKTKKEKGTAADSPLAWVSAGGRLDPLVASAAAAVRMKDAMDALSVAGRPPSRPTDTRLGRFFQQSYRVGSEELTRDIPTLVLLEIVAKVLLVARSCVLGLFGEDAKRIRRNLLYRLCIDFPLRAFYSLVSLSLRAPGAGLGIFLGMGVVSFLAILVGVLWWTSLIQVHGVPQPRGIIVFLLVPVLVLGLQTAFLLWGGRLLVPRWGVWASLALTVGAAALVLGVFLG